MLIEIVFENHLKKRMSFQWILFDRRYVTAWKAVLLQWKATWGPSGPELKEKWFNAGTKEDFINRIQEMKILIEQIDSLGVYHIGSQNVHENITREELNRVHEMFHQFVESCEKDSNNLAIRETEYLCHRLNDLTHLTEHAYYSRNSTKLERRVVATAVHHFQADYEVTDYEYYTATMCAGWIYMGYATPGKNLFHCFCDNDIEVVQKKMVRQSQGISNEIHIEFDGPAEINFDYEKHVREGYYSWCESNLVMTYGYDYKKPVYNPGRIPIAYPKDSILTLVQFFENQPGSIRDIHFI